MRSARFLALALAVIAPIAGCLRLYDSSPDGDASVDAPNPDADSDLSAFDCAVDLPCGTPTPGQASVCGTIYDIETEAPIRAPNPTRQACTAITPDGPCSLRIRYFDALDFAMNPQGAVPLVADSAMLDDCGRFRALDLPRATFGFIGIAVDDAAGTDVRHRLTSVAVSNAEAGGDAAAPQRAYATAITTDELWGTSAGLSGMTFAERGVMVVVFLHAGQPVSGVAVRRNDLGIPADDLYFSDPGITRRVVAPAQTSTGTNGTALVVNSATPIAHDGVGGAPAGCVWPSRLGSSIPGTVFMQRKEAETPSGAPCP